MNKKPTKFRETRGNRHPSQNDLPSIDKFHPDYWYYREEMDEPDDIDINYENESRHRNKKVIRLTESELKHIIAESVRSILHENDLFTNNQIRNVTGISDDDELNAACETEDAEELLGSIARDLCEEYGYSNLYDKNAVFDFDFVKSLLEEKYGMRYLGYDEESEAHSFGDGRFTIRIWSEKNYPRLAKFHFNNMIII